MYLYSRHGRRTQFYWKFTACLLIAVFYFAILLRESINAFEQNKEKGAVAASLLNNAGDGTGIDDNANQLPEKLKVGPKLHKSKRKHHALSLQKQQQQKLKQSQPTESPTANTVTLPSTLNPVYEYSEEIHSATERDLERRRTYLNAVCERYNLQSRYPPNPWEFFISPGHNLVWCNVFKAASSTWLYYFNILGGYDIRFLQRTETQPIELARKRFPRPELDELRDSLPAALSFLFVRDPLERIVSAYRNKLEGGRNSFYKVLGNRIIQQLRHRNGAAASARARISGGPTFNEFVHFLISEYAQGKRFDEHWAPVYSFCTPCSVNFTIIGKLETFQRDSEFIIRQAGLESLLLGKLPRHKLRKIGNLAKGIKTDALVARYFTEIDRDTLDQLLNIYRLDFELFDYDYNKYYELVQQAAVAAASTANGDNGSNSNNTTAAARVDNSTSTSIQTASKAAHKRPT